MKKINLLTLAIVILSSTISMALVRVIPRSDYGTFQDRLKGIGAKLQGEPMGGAYDIVYTTDLAQDQQSLEVSILKCPTLKYCSAGDRQCMSQPQYWNCEEIYQNGSKQTCRYYRTQKIIRSVLTFAAEQVAGDLIFAPMAFFSTEIGKTIAEVSSVYDSTKEVRTLNRISCENMDVSLNESDLNPDHMILKVEDNKGQVRQLLSIFTPTVNSNNTEDAFPDSQSSNEFPKPIELDIPAMN